MPQRRNSHQLDPFDARHFAVMKESNHVSIVIMRKFIHVIGRDCTRPPQQTPSMAAKAPVGAKVLQPRGRYHKLLVLENPVRYADFVVSVSQMKEDKTQMCRICWKTFETGYTKKRNEWRNKLPSVSGFAARWKDIQLEMCSSLATPRTVFDL
ncbi:hypothetical protein Hypma_002724 [Hypsizygus marmoreus]|uniref:Uncharacterized protein n=1 Tax=Hypsizygus marmoreus TaxID=39966 RepID=A0A369J9V0_HYPMA|nr:hypothetical protein Hypma_002724 [Hypsizygus marmoreus]